MLNKLINMLKRNKKYNFKVLGTNVIIQNEFSVASAEHVSIGDNVYIGPRCRFLGYGGIVVGSGTIIAHNVEILTRNHNYDSDNLKSIPYDNIYLYKQVVIGENVWIGAHVLIVPGVTIGEGAVIGMGAVVSKNVPALAVVVGNPAVIVKYRDSDTYYELKSKGKIYLKLKSENYFNG